MKVSVSKNVKEFLVYRNISQEDLRRNIGVKSRQQVSSWFSGAEAIPDKHIFSIFRAYPELNANWVINGSGEMLNDKSEITIKQKGEYGFCEECIKKEAKLEYMKEAIEDKDEKLNKLSQKVGELIAKLEDCNEQLSGNGHHQANVG
jgi:transcriptional regulator with XRE-family HTH domain